MVAVKPKDVDAYLARVDAAHPVILVFGPDAGLVSERVNTIVSSSADDAGDPFSLVRLQGDEVAAEPGRLVEEAQTIPLFSGRRAVWVKAGSRNLAPAVEALLALPASECRVVIEAGDLRRSAPLRALCERARNAAALPCYEDDDRGLTRLIDSEMRAAGLVIEPAARAALLPLLGGDRIASRSELRKLALYALGRGSVGLGEVTAVVSDASEQAIDDLVDAALAGSVDKLEAELAKARIAGTSASSIFFAAQRQLAQLHRWRTTIEEGAPFSLEAALPGAQFRRKKPIEAALRAWNAKRLAAAMAELADAALASRRRSLLDLTIAEHALLDLAVKAKTARSGGLKSDFPD